MGYSNGFGIRRHTDRQAVGKTSLNVPAQARHVYIVLTIGTGSL